MHSDHVLKRNAIETYLQRDFDQAGSVAAEFLRSLPKLNSGSQNGTGIGSFDGVQQDRNQGIRQKARLRRTDALALGQTRVRSSKSEECCRMGHAKSDS